MRKIRKKELKRMITQQKKNGRYAVAELGHKIIDRAKRLGVECDNVPYLLWKFETLRYKVYLNLTDYLREDCMLFTLFDSRRRKGDSLNYTILYIGDAEAFGMEILRILNDIDSLHWK